MMAAVNCGCGKQTAPAKPTITLFAAASASDACDLLFERFDPNGEIAFRGNYASSALLARQIAQGAPADLFISASIEWADELEKQSLVAQRLDRLTNELVLIVPAGVGSKIANPTDLITEQARRLALADPDSVPAGIYAKQSLVSLGLWDRVSPKIVATEDVRAALALVERNEVSAAIVYATDAKITDKVNVVYGFDPSTHSPIVYPIVLLNRGKDNQAAQGFFQSLQTPDADAIFESLGFQIRMKSPTK